MTFDVITGEDFDSSFLPNIMALDAVVYADEYVGELANMEARYAKNNKSFVCILNHESKELAGYINFFPCVDSLYNDIIADSEVIRDDDISPDEVADYNTNENHLFIISIAVDPKYRDTDAIKCLSNSFIDYLNKINETYPITDITAAAVSEDGCKSLVNYMFRQVRRLSDGNIVYICKDKFLEKLLAKDLYFKSYDDDIYMFLPLADHKNNTRIKNLPDWRECDIPEICSVLLDSLEDSITYECSNAVANELKNYYIGEFSFLHSTDDYPVTGTSSYEEEMVIGESTGYVFLTSHHQSHMHIVTVFLPDYTYSSTQIEDQLSNRYLKILNPEDNNEYILLYDYLLKKYGLHQCGQEKTLLCMSNKPKNEMEFQNILSAEVYNSMHIDYHIKSEKIREMCENNLAQYDYYEVYMSSKVIAFIPNDYSDVLTERIELTATYLFIAELVMFQNTALAKMNIKVTNALSKEGDISLDSVLELYQEFGKSVRFWEINNFKYYGTQAETLCITEAFGNTELKATYQEHQQFLEHIVELKAAQAENRNNLLLNIVATFLAIVQIQPFAVELLSKFYSYMGIEAAYANNTFTTSLFAGAVTVFLIIIILRRRKKYLTKHNFKK